MPAAIASFRQCRWRALDHWPCLGSFCKIDPFLITECQATSGSDHSYCLNWECYRGLECWAEQAASERALLRAVANEQIAVGNCTSRVIFPLEPFPYEETCVLSGKAGRANSAADSESMLITTSVLAMR